MMTATKKRSKRTEHFYCLCNCKNSVGSTRNTQSVDERTVSNVNRILLLVEIQLFTFYMTFVTSPRKIF